MSVDLFLQGPEAYVPVLIISLIITLVAYGAFPFVFARVRKKMITKKRYNFLCYGVNFLVMLLFIAVNGKASSGSPYLLWTWVFSASGLRKLQKRGLLVDTNKIDYTKTEKYEMKINEESMSRDCDDGSRTVSAMTNEHPPITFCRKCGYRLIEGSKFCSKCGSSVVKE